MLLSQLYLEKNILPTDLYYRLDVMDRNSDTSMLYPWYKTMMSDMIMLNGSAQGNVADLIMRSLTRVTDSYYEGPTGQDNDDVESTVIELTEQNSLLYTTELLNFFDYFYEQGMQFNIEQAEATFTRVIEGVQAEQDRFNLV